MITRRFGCLRNLPDHRDGVYRLVRTTASAPPASADISAGGPPIWDQGGLGSCTAHATLGMLCYETKSAVTPSRLALYYFARLRWSPEAALKDGGCTIRDAMKVLREMGCADEEAWPYREDLTYRVRPGQDVVAQGLYRRLKSYHPVPTLAVLKGEVSHGHPVALAFSVPEGWDGDDLLQKPDPHSPIEGGHAVLAVGYDDARQALLIRNSWGTGAGRAGYFWMTYEMWDAWIFDAWSGRAI